ncbi:MAG: transglutaminase domain-containing protein [Alphaproteobacteria bacterium]
MQPSILDHYLNFSLFTYPGLYCEKLKKDLPNSIEEIGLLVRKQCIHRATLRNGNTGTNKDLRYGDMNKVPWFRQPEDDNLPSASAMISELYRRDEKGFTLNRKEENKIIVTCRFVAILTASILKSKGIPTRVRSGFAPYFMPNKLNKSFDHWINQYWSYQEKRWITIDVDGSLEDYISFNPYDIPDGVFDFAADAWIKSRNQEVSPERFFNAGNFEGLMPIAWELFYDFHSLMNSEIIYLHVPPMVNCENFPKISEMDLHKIDKLAEMMQKPDENFDELKKMWNTTKEFRILSGALL